MISRREAFATLASLLPAGRVTAEDQEKADVEELVKMLADALLHLRLTSPPIGSVQAFAGDWPPRKINGVWTELEMGWLLCDGRKLDDLQVKLHVQLEKRSQKIPKGGILAELRDVLPPSKNGLAEMLPDYRGVFLRGLDRSITGVAKGRDKEEKRSVGDEQGCATAMPTRKFSTSEAGEHTHPISTRFNWGTDPNKDGAEVTTHNKTFAAPGAGMQPAGKHIHEIIGGDAESRPINIAVNYIIKFQ